MSVPRWALHWVIVVGVVFRIFTSDSDEAVIGLTPLGVFLLDAAEAAVRLLTP